jgi:hypothetical protein
MSPTGHAGGLFLCDSHHSGREPNRILLRPLIVRGSSLLKQQESDMTHELNIAELDLVSGGDLKEVHFRPDYKEPTVLLDDGINIQTTGLFHSNVGYDSPFTPIPA